MRKLFLFSFLLLFAVYSIGQNKVERFCKINITYSKHNEVIELDYGNKASFSILRDSSFLSKMEEVKNLKNGIEAINFMIDLGWEFVSIVNHNSSINPGQLNRDYIYFKGFFDK